MPDYKKKKSRILLLSFLISFFTISIVTTGFLLMFLSQSNRSRQSELESASKSSIDTLSYFITYKINRLTFDLEFISDIMRDHYPADNDFSDIESILLAYSNRRNVFDQIRYLNLDGDEMIRINYDPNGAYVVPQKELQNKYDRYYFQSTVSLEPNHVYISPLDLNIENNQIETPYKPIIRLGMPFFNASGEKTGIIVLNYSANDILNQIQTIATSNVGYVFLLNQEGYWLYNQSDSSKEWAFIFDPESGVSFGSEYPEEWNTIQSNASGNFTTKNGSFSYAHLLSGEAFTNETTSCTIISQTGTWYVVNFIPSNSPEWRYFQNQIGDLLLYIVQKYYVFYFVFLGISAILAMLFTGNRMKKEQVQYYSEYDVMTNSYNRNAGIQRLNSLYKNLSKNNCMTSLCFLDVNGLKEVNDVLGHEAGDELLITVANTIRSRIRADDFMIRFGGDEFVVVFSGVAPEQAEQVWERIVEAFEEINRTDNREYVISVSHGIQEISCAADQSLDTVLHQADEKMYEEKRDIKSRVQIIRHK